MPNSFQVIVAIHNKEAYIEVFGNLVVELSHNLGSEFPLYLG